MLPPIFVCLFNCAPPVVVSVEASAMSPPTAGAQVVLIPSDPRIPMTDPTFVYLAKIAALALEEKGLHPTPAGGAVRSFVAIGWRRDAPKVTTRVLHRGDSLSPSDLPVGPAGGSQAVRGLDGTTSLAEALNPGLRDARQPITQKITRYPWTIELKALDPAGPDATPLWRVSGAGESDSEDPADIAPQIIAASAPFIGVASARKQVRISAGDAAVKAILDGTPKAKPE
jgi:hypothetical protein